MTFKTWDKWLAVLSTRVTSVHQDCKRTTRLLDKPFLLSFLCQSQFILHMTDLSAKLRPIHVLQSTMEYISRRSWFFYSFTSAKFGQRPLRLAVENQPTLQQHSTDRRRETIKPRPREQTHSQKHITTMQVIFTDDQRVFYIKPTNSNQNALGQITAPMF